MKIKFLMLFAFIVTMATYGQNVTVTGTIIEASSGIPLPGVNVILKNTSIGASTDFDGNFTINDVPLNSVVVISYLGFITQEITVINGDPLSISLEEDAESLNEVVVIGYGTQRKKEITGAVSVISNETIEKLKPTRVEQALQGQVAGVNVTSTSGAPGAGLTINIRGVSTNGKNNPLILVDGNVIEDLSVINPNDIETINVLKDATAGIYGVRAANGVILITTKTGRKNMPLTIDLNIYGGTQTTSRKIPVLNATEYGLLLNEASAANGDPLPYPDVSGLGQGTNWQDEIFQSAPIVSTAINFKGGTENSAFAFGTSYFTQDGIVGGNKSNFTRFTQSGNYSIDFLENFKFNVGLIWNSTNRRVLNEGGLGSVLFNSLNMAPTFPIRQANGDYSIAEGLGNEVINPLAQIDNTYDRNKTDRISGNAGLSYNFLEHFTAQANYQFNYSKVRFKTFRPEAFFGSGKVFNVDLSEVLVRDEIYRDYTFDAFVKYENTFNDTHKVNFLLGTSVFQTEGVFAGERGFGIRDNYVGNAFIDQAERVENINQDRGFNPRFDDRLLSYFARLQYDYKGKYLLSAVIRRDGSSKFGPENRFGVFPSISAGWIATEEAFLQDNKFIDFLKIRASYGILGNDRIDSFQFTSILDGQGIYVFDGVRDFGVGAGALANPGISWEQQKTYDIGLDLRFWDNKIDVTIDYFNKRTEDLLVQALTSGILGPAAPGAQPPFINAGIVENSGLEFAIGYREQISDDFGFSINYNITTLKNEVIEVSSEGGFIAGGSFGVGQDPPSRMEAGQPIGYFRGYRTGGIFQNQAQIDNSATINNNVQPGDLIFVDLNGDGVIDELDKTNIGDPLPDATMGLNLAFDYKNWDFAAYAFASVGNEIVRNYERNQPLTNRSVSFLNRWTGEGTSNSFPRVTTGANSNGLFSDFFVEDGSFVRLQNIQLGYTLSEETIEKMGITKLRIYVSASNLFTLTEYTGYDPTTTSTDAIGGGIDYGFYPSPRTFLLGMNLKF